MTNSHLEAMVPTSPAQAVLVLSSNDKTRSTLLALLADGGWPVQTAGSYLDAMTLMERQNFPVVIANGNWREILEFSHELPKPPAVIVTTPLANEALWAEVLNLGGFDVLAQPFDHNEVTRIVHAAFRRAKAATMHA